MPGKRKIRTPSQDRSVDSKERIFNAAFKLLKQNGYENTGVRDIVNAAEVSIGSFYAYFKDKSDIAQEILKRYGEEFYGSLATDIIASLPANAATEKIIYQLLKQMHSIALKNKKLHRELEILSLSNDKVSKAIREIEIQRIREELGKLMEHFTLNRLKGKPDSVFRVVQRTMDDIVSFMVLQGFEIPDEEIFRETAKMIGAYLEKE